MFPPSSRRRRAHRPRAGCSTARAVRAASRRIISLAFVVKVVHYGDADAVVTFFTEAIGKVAALARGARKSKRRFAGSLESMHTIRVTLEERPGAELASLREAAVDKARSR